MYKDETTRLIRFYLFVVICFYYRLKYYVSINTYYVLFYEGVPDTKTHKLFSLKSNNNGYQTTLPSP